MRANDLVFWLDQLRSGAEEDVGVLCQRHADTMIVPRNWTLDDLRDPDLHLFRPPAGEAAQRGSTRRGRVSSDDTGEQLAFGVDVAADDDSTEPSAAGDDTADHGAVDEAGPEPASTGRAGADRAGDGAGEDEAGRAAADPESWTPTFDSADDLGGLLSARSPLLARAFRGDDRPRS